MEIFDLHGKTALITGASSGLGARFVHVLVKAGTRVILTARRLDQLETVANEIKRKGFDAVPNYHEYCSKEISTKSNQQTYNTSRKY
ncbi:MAG: SDR family NAD(P)-dependent oxidoreductase [Rickettsiales bacterium]|nr:SDR family NAD(P)-dependent oxidoreductase [Rickettsiales bacterium]